LLREKDTKSHQNRAKKEQHVFCQGSGIERTNLELERTRSGIERKVQRWNAELHAAVLKMEEKGGTNQQHVTWLLGSA